MKKLLSQLLLVLSLTLNCYAQKNNWADVDNVFGRQGTVKDGVWKLTFQRSDLKVKIGSFSVDPGLALTSWAGIIKTDEGMPGMGGNYMMMGDLVLLDGEVSPVLITIVKEGLNVTALHNHLIGETPAVKYLHYSGRGDAIKLAHAIKLVLQVTGTPLTAPTTLAPSSHIDWSKVESVLGPGTHNGKLLQYSFPRNEKLTESGMEMPPFIGMATGITFQMGSNEAAITGDFVLLADEVNPVLKTLTENGIRVTAIHNHMLYDNPRLFMLHYWAVDSPEKLAKGFKAALDKTNYKKLVQL